MDIIGWVVRTGSPDGVRYWRVGDIDPERAVRIASIAAGTGTAQTISRISARAVLAFAVSAGVATEIWPRRTKSGDSDENSNAVTRGEITFDTIIGEEGALHAEGCYRVDDGDWQVYYFTHQHQGKSWRGPRLIRTEVIFQSGITGVDGVLPVEDILNKAGIIRNLAQATGVDDWTEVSGPNSLTLK